MFQEISINLLVCRFPWRRAIFTLSLYSLLQAFLSLFRVHDPAWGSLWRLSSHFLHSVQALIENLGGLAYLFSWNVVGYIFMALSQQCNVSISKSLQHEGKHTLMVLYSLTHTLFLIHTKRESVSLIRLCKSFFISWGGF